jgi:hypothetical protein
MVSLSNHERVLCSHKSASASRPGRPGFVL